MLPHHHQRKRPCAGLSLLDPTATGWDSGKSKTYPVATAQIPEEKDFFPSQRTILFGASVLAQVAHKVHFTPPQLR